MLRKNGGPDPAEIHSFERHWPSIQPVVKRLLYRQHISKVDWQNLFCDVHMICSWDDKGCHKLLEALELELTETFIYETRVKLLSFHVDDCQQRLKEYIACWTEFKRHCYQLPVAFQQLDLATRMLNNPISLQKKQNDSTVRALMLKLWNRHILSILSGSLQDGAIELISAERNGHIIDSQLVVGLRESFQCLNDYNLLRSKNDPIDFDPKGISYIKHFETAYIQEIEIFYSSRALEIFRESGVLEYIRWATYKLGTEQQSAELYLGARSTAMHKVKNACTKVLVANFAEEILDESPRYIQTNDLQNMRLLFRFLSKIGPWPVNRFLEDWRDHILSSAYGNLVVDNTIVNNNCEKFVEKLIESYNQFDQINRISFSNDSRATAVLDQALETIVNDARIFQRSTNELNSTTPVKNAVQSNSQPESRCAEFLASYCDLLFRRTAISRKLTPEEVSDRLGEILLIIRFVKNKEAFIKHHKLHLSRRLVLNATINMEKEENFITNLKELVGVSMEGINKLDRMFKDIKSSEHLQQQYRNSLQPICQLETANNNVNLNNNNNTISSITSQLASNLSIQDNNNKPTKENYDSINIKILNPSSWPNPTDQAPICLPTSITSIMPSFEAFYCDTYGGRKLEWSQQLSNGVIAYSTAKGKFDLEVTAAQLSILYSYNDDPKGCKTIRDFESILSSIELKRTLWSLTSNPRLKVQLLSCEPQLCNFKDLDKITNKYSINHEFVLIKNGKPQPKGRVSLIGRLQI